MDWNGRAVLYAADMTCMPACNHTCLRTSSSARITRLALTLLAFGCKFSCMLQTCYRWLRVYTHAYLRIPDGKSVLRFDSDGLERQSRPVCCNCSMHGAACKHVLTKQLQSAHRLVGAGDACARVRPDATCAWLRGVYNSFCMGYETV